MKKILFFCFLIFSFTLQAGQDERTIFTKDKKCALHYLTQKEMKDWTIQVNPKFCENGWVNGYAEVELYTPFSRLSETLSGFFLDGYWLGNLKLSGQVLDRTTPELNQQALNVLLYQDKDISYVLQLRSISQENRAYGPFLVCPDFRMLVVVPDPQIFLQESFQEKIRQKVLSDAKMYCDDLEQVAIFGSSQINPSLDDIVFQMQIEAQSGEYTLVKMVEKKISLVNENHKVLPPSQKKSENHMTALAHLDVMSRLENTPKKGRIIVHIQKLNLDGSAWVDLPQPLLLKYNSALKEGWMVVEGTYFHNEMTVSDIQVCEQDWCQDVS